VLPKFILTKKVNSYEYLIIQSFAFFVDDEKIDLNQDFKEELRVDIIDEDNAFPYQRFWG
jgi:hypothetical protein